MSLFTSTHFASACATGSDWREAAKNILEKLDDVRGGEHDFNFGFLYISDHLAQDTPSILNLFKSVLKIENWVGSVGIGVIGCNESHIDTPAISAMLCELPQDSFCLFPETDEQNEPLKTQESVKDWLMHNIPLMCLVHGDPMAEEDPQDLLKNMETITNSFLLGGMSSSRQGHYQIAGNVFENALCGAFLSPNVTVASTISQGCKPISDFHTITKADENVILELDDKNALNVFQDELTQLAAQKTGHEIDEFPGGLQMIKNSDHIPPEFQSLFKGDIHIAISDVQSDQNHYTVRNITGIDTDEGSLSISETIAPGDRICFIERTMHTLESDLAAQLVALQKRVTHERGCFDPKAALYISCVARGLKEPTKPENDEIRLIHDIIGNIPMTGFYASGEINNARLYGSSAILTLFF